MTKQKNTKRLLSESVDRNKMGDILAIAGTIVQQNVTRRGDAFTDNIEFDVDRISSSFGEQEEEYYIIETKPSFNEDNILHEVIDMDDDALNTRWYLFCTVGAFASYLVNMSLDSSLANFENEFMPEYVYGVEEALQRMLGYLGLRQDVYKAYLQYLQANTDTDINGVPSLEEWMKEGFVFKGEQKGFNLDELSFLDWLAKEYPYAAKILCNQDGEYSWHSYTQGSSIVDKLSSGLDDMDGEDTCRLLLEVFEIKDYAGFVGACLYAIELERAENVYISTDDYVEHALCRWFHSPNDFYVLTDKELQLKGESGDELLGEMCGVLLIEEDYR